MKSYTDYFTNLPTIDYNKHPAYTNYKFKNKLILKIRYTLFFLKYLLAALQKTFRYYLKIKLTPTVENNLKEQSKKKLIEFQTNGLVAFKISDNLIQDLKSEILKVFNIDLSKISRKNFEHRFYLDTKKFLKLEPLSVILDEVKILEIASNALKSKRVSINSVKLRVNTESHTNDTRRNVFKDIGIKDPITNYYHVDSSGTPNKSFRVIMYLNDVDYNNGPFSYILGSHKTSESYFKHLIRTANHRSRLQDTDTINRAKFSLLPKFFQAKAEFGNDLIDAKIIKNMLSSEKVCTSKEGQILLADVSGIHRGGIVNNGERISLIFTIKVG